MNAGESFSEILHLGLNTGVGIQHNDITTFFHAFEVIRDHTRALVRPGRTTVRFSRNAENEGVLFGHCLQLRLQRQSLRPCLPSMYNFDLRGGATTHGQCIKRDARR